MWQYNLAELHLTWALELYRVVKVEEAEKHSVAARALLPGNRVDNPEDSPGPKVTRPTPFRVTFDFTRAIDSGRESVSGSASGTRS